MSPFNNRFRTFTEVEIQSLRTAALYADDGEEFYLASDLVVNLCDLALRLRKVGLQEYLTAHSRVCANHSLETTCAHPMPEELKTRSVEHASHPNAIVFVTMSALSDVFEDFHARIRDFEIPPELVELIKNLDGKKRR